MVDGKRPATQDLAAGAITGAITALVCVFAYRKNPYFFYWDDAQNYFMPLFVTIGHELRAGHWPMLLPQSWFMNNAVAEYQAGLQNPVLAAMQVLMSSCRDLRFATLLLAGSHLTLLSVASYALARRVGANRSWSMAAGVAIAGQPFLLYWLASAWWSGMLSEPWLVITLVGLVGEPRRLSNQLIILAGTYLTFSTGWMHADLALVAAVLVVFASYLARGDVKSALLVAASSATGVALCLPVLVVVASAAKGATRDVSFGNTGILTTDLNTLFTSFLPFHHVQTLWIAGLSRLAAPVGYVAWFVLPALAVWQWSDLKEASFRLRVVCAWTVIYGVMVLGPEMSGPSRWPIRYLPVFAIALAVLAAAILSQASQRLPNRRRFALMALTLALYLSWSAQPSGKELVRNLVAALVGWLVAEKWVTLKYAGPWLPTAMTVAVLVTIVWVNPSNPNLPSRGPAATVEEAQSTGHLGVPPTADTSVLYLTNYADADRLGLVALPWGASAFLVPEARVINGYTPLAPIGLSRLLCLDNWTSSCLEIFDRLFARDPDTGQTWADELRVSRLVVERGEREKLWLARKESQEWHTVGGTSAMVAYDRNQVLPKQAYVPTSPSLAVELEHESAEKSEWAVLRNDDEKAETLILSRPWYPGYRATLDGRPLDVFAHAGVFASVSIPPHQIGKLSVWYEPWGWRWAVTAAMAAVVLLLLIYRWALRAEQ